MTTGLIPSSDPLPSQTISPIQQDNSADSRMRTSLPPTSRLERFGLFCLQHPEFLKLIVQCFLTLVILSFSIFQLANGGRDGQGKNDALYWGCITSILAWWMPSPAGATPRNQANFAGSLNVETTVESGNPQSGTGNGSFLN